MSTSLHILQSRKPPLRAIRVCSPNASIATSRSLTTWDEDCSPILHAAGLAGGVRGFQAALAEREHADGEAAAVEPERAQAPAAVVGEDARRLVRAVPADLVPQPRWIEGRRKSVLNTGF